MRVLTRCIAPVLAIVAAAWGLSAAATALAEPGSSPAAATGATAANHPAIDWDKLYKYESRGGSSQKAKPYVAPRPFGQYGYYGGYYGNPYAGYPYYGYSIIGSPNLFPYYDYGRYFYGYYPGYGGYGPGSGYLYDPGPVRWRSEDRLSGPVPR